MTKLSTETLAKRAATRAANIEAAKHAEIQNAAMQPTKQAAQPTFKTILQRNNAAIRADRAATINDLVKMDFDELVNTKKRNILSLNSQLDMMADLSTSNVTTSANRIEGIQFDSKAFVAKRAQLRMDILLAKEELSYLMEDAAFYGI